ncbi:hypothetical protein DES34_11890 [Brevibacillus brevis]|nr:hypothetical protein C7J99_26615 [Brevibacillus brevis]RED21825.1 hypothetical protein DES34_11890 [Brevibacillus brevis]GEC93064.1 hypothetical protein BBR01nite_53950 [Brevibacillus brevis]VEF92688.1 Uncharacterised protein [Brevibacillus brevis]
MNPLTDHYVKLHLAYLSDMPLLRRHVELSKHETIYDHMYEFLCTVQELSHESALSIVDDFRSDAIIQDVREARASD